MEQDELEKYGAHAQVAGMTQKNAAEAAQQYIEEKEKSIVDIQLEVDTIKKDIYHLLKQDRLVIDKETQKMDWEPLPKENRTITDWGVERLMQVIHFYINKNTLLTNFDFKQIREIMLTFMKEINDLVLLKYEYLFRQPTESECLKEIEQKIEDNKQRKKIVLRILGRDLEDNEIEDSVIEKFEDKLNLEVQKIKAKRTEENIREYGLLIAQLEVIVYSTLNRAFRGEERGSLRRHMNVSELIGGAKSPASQGGGGSMFSWGSK